MKRQFATLFVVSLCCLASAQQAQALMIVTSTGPVIVAPNPGTGFELRNTFQTDTEVSIFLDSTALRLDDPTRPGYVWGDDQGPWDWSLTGSDPYGNAMPYPGVKFSLQPGANPFDLGDMAFFFAAADPISPPLGNFTVFQVDSVNGIYQYSGPVVVDDWDVPSFADPIEMYNYIVETYIIPEPASLALLALGSVLLLTTRGFSRAGQKLAAA